MGQPMQVQVLLSAPRQSKRHIAYSVFLQACSKRLEVATTFVQSETAHFMNQGQKMAYEEIGIKQYRFVAALSELT